MKKKVVLYGNCHMSAIKSILLRVDDFTAQYEIIDIPSIQDINVITEIYPVLAQTDVFIHQEVQRLNIYGEKYSSYDLKQHLKKGCLSFSIPNIYGLPKFLFPMNENNAKITSILKRRGTIFYVDKVIDEYFNLGVGINTIVNNYVDYCSKFLCDYSDPERRFFDKLKEREADWDISVLDFVQDNYKKYRLFFDPYHPTSVFLKYITIELLKLLDIDSDKWRNIIATMNVAELDRTEMPLLPIVCRQFNLQYGFEFFSSGRARVKFYGRMDIKEYVKEYIALEWRNGAITKKFRIKSFIYYCGMQFLNVLYMPVLFVLKRKK